MKRNGFTLIEALIALTIIAIALIASLKAAGNLNAEQDQLLQRNYAQWSASNFATHLRTSGIFPNTGQFQGACNQAHFQFICKVKVQNTPNIHFRRIEVTVHDQNRANSNYQLARLVVFLSNAP